MSRVIKHSMWRVAVCVSLLSVLWLLGGAVAQDVDLSAINCSLTPDQINEQANAGFAGAANAGFAGAANAGFAGAGGEYVTQNNLLLDGGEDALQAVEDVMSNWNYAADADPQTPVAIIVIDDFSTDEPADAADWDDVSHGWYVLDVLHRLYATLPQATQDQIMIETLDVTEQSFRSDLIRSALIDKINDLYANSDITRFVLNMSFVFVECDTTNSNRPNNIDFNHADFIEQRDDEGQSLISYLGGDPSTVQDAFSDQAIERLDTESNRGGPPEDVAQKLQFMRLFEISEMNSDPLRAFFRSPIRDSERDDDPDNDLMLPANDLIVVPIASAGNFKWRRPFFPAQWNEVLSVSALEGVSGTQSADDARQWQLSNNGEVSVPGAYYTFPDNTYRGGTSFAAPLVALIQAVDLTQSEPTCGVANNGRPELSGSQNFDNPILQDRADSC